MHTYGSFKAYLRNINPSKQILGRDFIFPPDYNPICLVSYPKSGNTWLRFLLSNVLANSECCISFNQLETIVPDLYTCNKSTFKNHLSKVRPHFIKSHECYNPMYKKVVYIVRDPRDVAVSYYWHFLRSRRVKPDDLNINKFVLEFFLNGFSTFGNWLEHVSSWQYMSRHVDIMTLKYESLQRAPNSSLEKVLRFANVSHEYSEKNISIAVDLSDLSNLKRLEAKSGNTWSPLKKGRNNIPFFRNGKSQHFHEELSAESINLITCKFGDMMNKYDYC